MIEASRGLSMTPELLVGLYVCRMQNIFGYFSCFTRYNYDVILLAFLAACPCMLFIDIISLFINWANKDACLLAGCCLIN